jgi:hypothetical protein
MSFYGVTVSSAGDRRVQQRCDQSALPALSPLFGLWFLFPPRLPPPVGLRAASECARSQGVGVVPCSRQSWQVCRLVVMLSVVCG